MLSAGQYEHWQVVPPSSSDGMHIGPPQYPGPPSLGWAMNREELGILPQAAMLHAQPSKVLVIASKGPNTGLFAVSLIHSSDSGSKHLGRATNIEYSQLTGAVRVLHKPNGGTVEAGCPSQEQACAVIVELKLVIVVGLQRSLISKRDLDQ